MSRTTMLMVFKTKVSWDLELPNAHGSGPCLWDYLSAKYFPDREHWFIDGKVIDELFAMLDTDKLLKKEKVALALTGERCVISKEYLPLAAKLIGQLAEDVTKWRKPEFVNHWPEIASFIERAARTIDRRAIGVGMDATSVGDTWDNYPKGIPLFIVPEHFSTEANKG